MNVLILIILCCVTTAVHALINPILPGWNPDPSLLRVGDDFFIATSTFEYFPGVPIYHSRNLVDWTLIGHALNRPSQLALFGTPSDAGIWAPSLRYYNGTFYLATTTRYVYSPELRLFPRSFYVSTTDIFSNEWSDPVYFDHLGYDADLFWDTNGDVYATWAGIDNAQDKIYGIYQSQIDIDTGNSLTPAELIFTGTLENNSSARPEGPHIYLVNGTYYLLIAEGGTGESHRATVQRGPSPSGPWENNPANPILYNGRDSKNVLQATGHADFAEGPDGRWWGSALAVVPQNGNFSHQQLGRQTILFPVTWESGWPVFNGGESVTPHMADVLSDVSPLTIYFNDFISLTNQSSKTSLKSLDPPGSEIVLDDSFYTIRTPQKPFYSLAAREGHLRVYGNGFKVGDRDTPALLLRKQAAYTEEFEVVLDDFKPRSSSTGGVGTENGGREEAGATILYSDFLHDDIGVTSANGTGVDGKRAIVTRTIVQAKQAGPWALGSENNTVINVTYHPLKSASGPVKLVIRGDPTSYTLGYAEAEDEENDTWGDIIWTGSVDASAISVPPAGWFFFKGAAFGVYNTGTGRPSLTPADFRHWKQTPQDPTNQNVTQSQVSLA